MARGRKKALTPDEQLEQVNADIEATEIQLNELKKKKEDLEQQIRVNRIEKLEALISSHGLSIEEVEELLEKQ